MATLAETAASEAMAPVADRVHVIDSLRALALFGVIAMNFVGMVAAIVPGEIFSLATSTDLGVATFDLVLLQGKARASFALLFGMGFGILMERAAARGTGFTGFYLRRMTVLLGIGLCNLAFLFWGDILILYALLGMVMLLFRGWSDRALVTAGLLLTIVPPLVAGAIEAATGAPLPNLAGMTPDQVAGIMDVSIPVYRGHDYLAGIGANFRYYWDHYRSDTSYAAMYDLGILGLFMLGLWAARNRVLADIERWRPLLRRVAWWCLPIGLVLSAVHATRRMGIPASGLEYAAVTAAYAGLAILAFGYIAALALFLTRRGRPLAGWLAPLGRMALTGYLASNAIGSFTWYGWGFGQMGKWNVAAINGFALATYIALCLFAAAWLKHFRFGPAEWVWRSLTYGKPQPMRRVAGC